MKIGICTSCDQGQALKGVADHVEENVQRLLVGEADDAAFHKAAAGAADCPLPIPAANCYLPAHLKTSGPDRDMDALLHYTRTTMQRAQGIGIQTIVFGSGGARKLAAGTDRAAAEEQFVEVLQAMGPVAAEHGVVLAVEPLNSQECNFINSLAEGAALVRAADHPGIKLLADVYHMARDGEAPDEIVRHGDLLHHVHVAESGRTPPGVAGDDLRPYLRALAEIDYRGRLSLECRIDGDLVEAMRTAAATLRTQAADVGLA